MPAYFWQTKLEEVAIARAQDTVVNLELLGKLIAQQGRDFVEKKSPISLRCSLMRETDAQKIWSIYKTSILEK